MTHEQSVRGPSSEIAHEPRSYGKSFPGNFSLLSWREVLSQGANIITLGVDEALNYGPSVFGQTNVI